MIAEWSKVLPLTTRYLSPLRVTALIAEWSKVLPPTTCCLTPLPGFKPSSGHERKLPVGYSAVFPDTLIYSTLIQLAICFRLYVAEIV